MSGVLVLPISRKPAVQEPRHDRVGDRARRVVTPKAAERGGLPGDQVHVLDGYGHPVEGGQSPALHHRPLGLQRGLADLLVVAPDERSDLTIEPLDALQIGVGDLDRAQLALAYRLCQTHGGVERVHGGSNL